MAAMANALGQPLRQLRAKTLTFNTKAGQPFSASAASKVGSDCRSLEDAAECSTSKVQLSWSSGPARTVLRSGSGISGETTSNRALDSVMRCSSNTSGSLFASAADSVAVGAEVGAEVESTGRASRALAIAGV